MNREEICDWLLSNFPDEEFILADGLEDAFVGVNLLTMRTMYDSLKIMHILIEDSATYEDALEYFSFNIAGAYVGEKAPIFLYKDCIYYED
jgi:hypothetical protein